MFVSTEMFAVVELTPQSRVALVSLVKKNSAEMSADLGPSKVVSPPMRKMQYGVVGVTDGNGRFVLAEGDAAALGVGVGLVTAVVGLAFAAAVGLGVVAAVLGTCVGAGVCSRHP